MGVAPVSGGCAGDNWAEKTRCRVEVRELLTIDLLEERRWPLFLGFSFEEVRSNFQVLSQAEDGKRFLISKSAKKQIVAGKKVMRVCCAAQHEEV